MSCLQLVTYKPVRAANWCRWNGDRLMHVTRCRRSCFVRNEPPGWRPPVWRSRHDPHGYDDAVTYSLSMEHLENLANTQVGRWAAA